MKSLKILLKKCPNIKTIELKESFGRYDYYGVFRLITDYCNNLRQIDFGKNEINVKIIKEFPQKLGPKIKSIHRLKDANNYNLFPNIEKLKFETELFCETEEFQRMSTRIKLNKLKKLEATIYFGEEFLIQTFVDTFPTLTHFSIKCCSGNQKIFNSFTFISNLKNLIHFGFDNFSAENDKLFCDSLKRMANKCQKLKSIEWSFNITDNSDIRQLLSPFEAFATLKRLCLTFNCQDFEDFDVNEFISFEAFKGLSNITHLTLNFEDNYENNINTNILTDIDINLPKLQYLEFRQITATPEEVTQMADILSRLSRLKTLKLQLTEDIFSDEIKEKIREKCKIIRRIDITEYNCD